MHESEAKLETEEASLPDDELFMIPEDDKDLVAVTPLENQAPDELFMILEDDQEQLLTVTPLENHIADDAYAATLPILEPCQGEVDDPVITKERCHSR